MDLSCRLKVTQVNPKVSGLVGLVFGLFASVFPVFGQYASLLGVCGVVRPWPSEGIHRSLHASQPEALAANTLFEETAGAVSGPYAHSGSRQIRYRAQ